MAICAANLVPHITINMVTRIWRAEMPGLAKKVVIATNTKPIPQAMSTIELSFFANANTKTEDIYKKTAHDVGMTAVKVVGFGQGVNVTLGLPFIRTSPDHGTAFDIAGKGIADAGSMKEAVKLACRLAGGGQRRSGAA